ncbi:MAG: vanadium-dependent haloperoxidase [Rickettsiales bacterium]
MIFSSVDMRTYVAAVALAASISVPSRSHALDDSDLVTQCVARVSCAAETPDKEKHEVATQWADFMLGIMRRTQGFTPPVVSRALAYSAIALYESLVPSLPEHKSLSGRLIDMPPMPKPEPDRQYYWPAVANAALAAIFSDIVAQSPVDAKNMPAIEEFRKKIADAYANETAARTIRRSEKYGRDVARAVYAWSMGDGAHEAHIHNFPSNYSIPKGEGMWEPTTPRLYPALQPFWGEKRPFVLKNSEELACGLPTPVPYSADPKSEFYAEAKEVYDAGESMTKERRDIAQFWNDAPRYSYTPPGHIFSILTQLLRQKDASLMFAADAYAKVSVALADAFVGCWAEKYRYNVIRPVTYIKRFIDKDWAALLSTPPFPEYPSGHSVQTGAATVVLISLFGEKYPFTDHSYDHMGYAPRSFSSFKEMEREVGISRLYGGIHYRASIERGIKQGECIGDKALKAFRQ